MITKLKSLLIYFAALYVSLANIKSAWAQGPGQSDLGNGSSNTPIKFTLKNYGFTDLGPLIQVLITLILSFAGLLFLFYFLIGGIAWITAGGDPKQVAAARSRLTNALIGFVLVVATYAIILIVEKVFGISIVSGINFK